MRPDFAAIWRHVNPDLAAVELQRANSIGAEINDTDTFAFEVGGVNLAFIGRDDQHPRSVLVELPIAHDHPAARVYFDHSFRRRACRPQPRAVVAYFEIVAAIVWIQFDR